MNFFLHIHICIKVDIGSQGQHLLIRKKYTKILEHRLLNRMIYFMKKLIVDLHPSSVHVNETEYY